MSKTKKKLHVLREMEDEEQVRVYLNGVIRRQGCDWRLSFKGRDYAFVRVWATIPYYRWPDDDDRDPITRLADLIRNPEKKRDDPGWRWVDKDVESAIDEASAIGFGRGPGKKKAPIFDSAIVDFAEPLVADPSEALEEAELQERLMEEIRNLGDLDQQVLAATYWEGRDISTTREILGCGRAAAYERRNKILKKLKRVLDEHR